MTRTQRYVRNTLGLALAAVLAAACGSSSTTASPSAPSTSASSSAQPTHALPSSLASQADAGGPPAQAVGAFAAQAAPGDVGVQGRYLWPDDEQRYDLQPIHCLHGDSTQAQWVTALCHDGDPNNPGYIRYYDADMGPDAWVATFGRAADGYVYMQNRWDAVDPVVWFRYPVGNPNALEISVTPAGSAALDQFVPIGSYDQQSGARHLYRMTFAEGSMLVMQLTVIAQGGPDPLSPTQIAAAESQGGVPTVLQGLNRVALADILTRDPIDNLAS